MGRPRRPLPDDAARWVLAKATETPLWRPGWITPRPAWSFAEIARNFNRSRTAERLGFRISVTTVRLLAHTRGGAAALRYRRRGRYPNPLRRD
jgi:hypothetical protein